MSDLEVQIYLDSLVENISSIYGYECYVSSGGDYTYAVLDVLSPTELSEIDIENIKQLLPLWYYNRITNVRGWYHIYSFKINDIRGEIRKSNLKELI